MTQSNQSEGWLTRILNEAVRDVSALPGWLFNNGVNPHAPSPALSGPHTCVLAGFGESPHDVCPACEFNRLTGLGVPEEVALPVARLRALNAPDDLSPRIIQVIEEELRLLEGKYGKEIP